MRNLHLAACDSVYEAGDELWIQRQAFHYVDGFTRNSLVIYRQLVQPWRTNKEAHENIGIVSITTHMLLLLVIHHFYVVIFFPFSISVCWTLQISPLGFLPLSALYIICHPSYSVYTLKRANKQSRLTEGLQHLKPLNPSYCPFWCWRCLKDSLLVHVPLSNDGAVSMCL